MDRLEVAKGVEATRDFALFLRDERALVISDLHLGFEGALAEQGVSIPRFQRRGVPRRAGKKAGRREGAEIRIAGGVQTEALQKLCPRKVAGEQDLPLL